MARKVNRWRRQPSIGLLQLVACRMGRNDAEQRIEFGIELVL
jgi:hypothetical protein